MCINIDILCFFVQNERVILIFIALLNSIRAILIQYTYNCDYIFRDNINTFNKFDVFFYREQEHIIVFFCIPSGCVRKKTSTNSFLIKYLIFMYIYTID